MKDLPFLFASPGCLVVNGFAVLNIVLLLVVIAPVFVYCIFHGKLISSRQAFNLFLIRTTARFPKKLMILIGMPTVYKNIVFI